MEKYKHLGLKLTPQRLAILHYLDGNTCHPSAEEVYKAVSKKFPTMSFATVYNTLDALQKQGGVIELTIDPNKKRFDPNTEPHHHLICVQCRKIVDIHRAFELQIPKGEVEDFQVLGKHIEFYGLCPKCKGKNQV